MPTYQYVCIECGTPLEVVQSFTDPARTECPTCGGRLRKVFSAVGVVFKGSGFYRNDSRSEKTSVGAKATSSNDSTSSSDSSSSGDSKPAGAKAGADKTSGSSKGAGSKPSSSTSTGASSSGSSPGTPAGKGSAPKD